MLSRQMIIIIKSAKLYYTGKCTSETEPKFKRDPLNLLNFEIMYAPYKKLRITF
jgi:hypothetical protein